MDASSVFDGLILLVGALLGILKQLALYLLSFLYLLASPFLYLGHGLLTLALFPLRIVLHFEAFIYFVTGAVLAGVIAGLFLHFAGDSLSQLLRLHPSNSRPNDDSNLINSKELAFDWESKWRDQYLPSTILEEDENSQASG